MMPNDSGLSRRPVDPACLGVEGVAEGLGQGRVAEGLAEPPRGRAVEGSFSIDVWTRRGGSAMEPPGTDPAQNVNRQADHQADPADDPSG